MSYNHCQNPDDSLVQQGKSEFSDIDLGTIGRNHNQILMHMIYIHIKSYQLK